MKPITKQLVIGAFILALVTVASLGTRHIRFSVNRAKTIESPVIAEAEPDDYPTDPHTVVAEPEPQYVDALDSAEEAPLEDHSEAKPSKGDSGSGSATTVCESVG